MVYLCGKKFKALFKIIHALNFKDISMKKIILLFTFLFLAKVNFAQYNWQPMSTYGFGTYGTKAYFLEKHGSKLFSAIYNPSIYKPQLF